MSFQLRPYQSKIIDSIGRRNAIISKFERALDEGKDNLKDAITERLNEKLSIIYDDLERECTQFYDDVIQEEQEIKPVVNSYAAIQANFQLLLAKSHGLLD